MAQPLNDARTIKKHFDGIRADRSIWESLWQEVSEFCLGRRSFNQSFQEQGRGKRTRQIYDNTSMVANEMQAAGYHNILTPASSRWVHCEPEDIELLQDPESADWFAAAEDIFVRDLENYSAGFHDQISETYVDIAGFGNGALFSLQDDEKNLIFQSGPLAEIYIEEDQFGRVERIYRVREWSAAQIVAYFGNGKHEDADRAVAQGKLGQRFEILQALLPNPIFDPRRRFGAGIHQVKCWWIDNRKGDEIWIEYHREMPCAFGRVNKDPDEAYGRGSGVMAVSDQRMLSAMTKVTLTGAEKAVNPPLIVPDSGYITQLDMSPGGYTVAKMTDASAIRELYTRPGQNVELGVQLCDRRQTNIRAAYHYELLQLIQDPRMSATQVLELSARVQQILSPVVAALQSSLLQPIVTRAFNLELRAGKFPPVPAQLSRAGVRFRYVSPVQRAQRATEARAMMDAINGAMQLAQFDPKALDAIDGEAVTRFLWQAFGSPPNILRSRGEVDRLTAGRAALQQEQQQTAQTQAMADMAGKAAPALKLLPGLGKAA